MDFFIKLMQNNQGYAPEAPPAGINFRTLRRAFLAVLMIFSSGAFGQMVSYVNDDGNLLVDEEVFLPVGFYCEYMNFYTWPDLAQDIADGGFNTIVTETYVPDIGSYEMFLNQCNGLNLKNIIVLPQYLNDPSRFDAYVNALKIFPSLIGYNLLFNANYAELAVMEQQKQRLQQLDTTRVSMADFELITPPFQYMIQHLESSIFYQGPWGYPWGTPDLDMVAYRYRFHKKTTAHQVVFPMIIAQTHNWENNSYPSPAHLDCQSYLGFIAGNKGILFYAFLDSDNYSTINITQPELYQAACDIATELLQSELKEVILHGEHQYFNIGQYRHYATWRYNNNLFVMAANASADNSFAYDIPLPDDVIGEPVNLFDYRPDSLALINNHLTGNLSPYQVAIYKMDLNTGFAEKQATEATITAIPNPTKESFAISGVENKFSCRVYNAQGRLVMSFTEIMPGEPINLEALPDGIYLLSISAKADKQNQTIKIIKY